MTSLRDRPFLSLFALALVFALAFGPLTQARAGGDDFEYGRALAALGTKTGDKAYFEYARRVFNGVISDANTSDAEKDLCRYGLAEMKRNEAMGATRSPTIPYADVVKLFKEAITTMEEFVRKNPDHKRASEASLAVGTTRLGFVQWARDQLLGNVEFAELKQADLNKVQADAADMVRGAISYFNKLRKGHDAMVEPKTPEAKARYQMAQIAQYYWVLCQYYLALVETPGSAASKDAFENAAKQLDDFISLNDGTLLAIYAQDIFGLTRWEQAKQADSEEDKEKFYGRAVEWFETCIETDVQTPDEERVVANGYYHLAQACREAGRVGSRNFHREGSNFLKDMETRYNTIWRQDNGVRAMLEWALLEGQRDRTNQAIEIASRARGYAKKLGKGWLEAQANKVLQVIVSGGGSGRKGGATADPTVLMGIADNFFNEKKYGQAIAAYQSVVGALKRSKTNVDAIVRCWERIAASYKEQGDLMASALALEPVHDAWEDGLVEKPGADDVNLIRFGNIRLRGQRIWKELYDLTGSARIRSRFTGIRDRFTREYPDHPYNQIGDWNNARDKLSKARSEKKANNSGWRATIDQADALFKRVAKDNASQRQDAAWTYLLYTQYLRDSWTGILKAHANATAFWESAAAKEQAKKFPSVAQRRKPERGKAGYWKAEAHYRLNQWDEILKTLDGWHVDYDALKGQGPYYAGALGHLVFAYTGKGDIPSADKYFKQLLAVDPKFRLLPKITFALAKHFNDKAKTIDKERKKARGELNGTPEKPMGARAQLRSVTKREHQTVSFLVDTQSKLAKLKELVRIFDDKTAKGLPNNIPPEDYEEAKKEIPVVAAKIKQLSTKANKLGTELQALQTEVANLIETIKQRAQDLYEPLTRAAGYFWEWDNALKRNQLPRDPANVAIFADLYYKAGLLRPEVPLNWERAQALYDDFLGMSGAEKDTRREAIGRLGTIYSRLAANAEAGSPQRAELVKKALDRLQGSLSNVPENNDLVVGLLEGKVVVIPWRKGNSGPLTRFPLPRVENVEAFKRAVDLLGKAGGTPIPKFATDTANNRYASALRDFKIHVGQVMTPREIERTVKGFAGAGFDTPFFVIHAESGIEFRLALAWIYSESGVREHMIKGYNLSSSVGQGRFAADENSEDWWAAQVIRLRSLVNGAQLDVQGAGAKMPPSANEWTRRASQMLRGLLTSSPQLGDDIRPETRGELKLLNQRIELLRGKVGLKPMNLLMDSLVVPSKDDTAKKDAKK